MTDGARREAAETPPTTSSTGPGRRDVLRAAGAVAAVGAVATVLTACGDESGATTSGGEGAGDTATARTGGAAAAGVTVAASEVPEGEAVSREVGGRTIILAQPSAGEFRAYDPRCPHQGCTVAVARALELACPCHASLFDATDGSVTQGPATTGLTELEVSVAGDELTIS